MNNQNKNPIDIVLADSLKELSKTRPIEKITIKEITDKAGVIRPTFYNHFQDKYELLEWIAVNELFAPIEPLLDNGLLKEALTCMLTTMVNGKDFYKKAVCLEGQNSFNEILVRCVAKEVSSHMDLEMLQSKVPYSWVTSDLIAEYYAQALCYGIISWVRKGMRIPVEEVVEVYLRLLQNSIVETIKELK